MLAQWNVQGPAGFSVDELVEAVAFSRASILLPNHLVELAGSFKLLDSRGSNAGAACGTGTNSSAFVTEFREDVFDGEPGKSNAFWGALHRQVLRELPERFQKDLVSPRLLAIVACQLQNCLCNWGTGKRKKWRGELSAKIVVKEEWRNFLRSKRRRST